MWPHAAIDTLRMQFLLNIDFDASRNTCYRRLYAAGLRTRSILSARHPGNSPVRTGRVSTYVCTGRVSTGLMYAHAALDYFHAVFVVRLDLPVHDCG